MAAEDTAGASVVEELVSVSTSAIEGKSTKMIFPAGLGSVKQNNL